MATDVANHSNGTRENIGWQALGPWICLLALVAALRIRLASSPAPGDDAYMTEKLARFSQPDIQDPARPRVLLMSFDYSSALNLQHVSHNIVFYAPLWGEDPVGVHAAANEQQAIGRVVRIGQTQDVVVHRLIVVGPKGQETIEQRIVERNTSQDVTRQAVNT